MEKAPSVLRSDMPGNRLKITKKDNKGQWLLGKNYYNTRIRCIDSNDLEEELYKNEMKCQNN